MPSVLADRQRRFAAGQRQIEHDEGDGEQHRRGQHEEQAWITSHDNSSCHTIDDGGNAALVFYEAGAGLSTGPPAVWSIVYITSALPEGQQSGSSGAYRANVAPT